MIVLISFDGDERSLIEKAGVELRIEKRMSYFSSLEQLLENPAAGSRERAPLDYPRVIVMNIDAPTCMDDLAALKSLENWKNIPVVGYGFLENTQDVSEFYGRGGASCIRKPETYEELVETTRAAMGYWLSMSTMPCDYMREA